MSQKLKDAAGEQEDASSDDGAESVATNTDGYVNGLGGGWCQGLVPVCGSVWRVQQPCARSHSEQCLLPTAHTVHRPTPLRSEGIGEVSRSPWRRDEEDEELSAPLDFHGMPLGERAASKPRPKEKASRLGHRHRGPNVSARISAYYSLTRQLL